MVLIIGFSWPGGVKNLAPFFRRISAIDLFLVQRLGSTKSVHWSQLQRRIAAPVEKSVACLVVDIAGRFSRLLRAAGFVRESLHQAQPHLQFSLQI